MIEYSKFKPDIVTLDLAMPLMDGFETLKRILALDKTANVIMLTASEQQELLERCLEKGAIGYISKPFTATELVTAINNAWKAGTNKNVTVLFSLAAKKIEDSIKKMTAQQLAVTVILRDIQVISRQKPVQMLSPSLDLAQIRSVPSITEDFETAAPRGTIGFVKEFGGQQKGTIISFIHPDDLGTLFSSGGNTTTTTKSSITDQAIEFFNIFNTKILSELANATHLVLSSEPTRMSLGMDKQEASAFEDEELTKAAFDIIIDKKRIPVVVQLWFNTAQLFRGRF